MGKVLVIAEKPSVGKDIAKALRVSGQKGGYIENDQYIITWAVGHLIGLKYPEEHNPAYKSWRCEDLPFVFPLSESLKVLPDTAAQFKVIKSLINRVDVDYLVNAGDAGREGLLIQEWIYRMAGNKKPIKMLWISSFTEEAVRKAFEQGLKERKDFLPLLEEAEARAQGDYLLGINYSRLLTLTRAAERTILSYGRCQTPLLNIIVKRDEEINRFRPTPYFNISVTYGKGFKGLLVDFESGKRIDLNDRAKAEEILKQLTTEATVVSYTEEEKSKKAPLLYNLATLQKVMGSKYGYTPDQTLAIAQALYEKHKILSYPRTDSQCLSTDLYHEINKHLQCCRFGRYAAFIDRIDADAIQPQKRYFNDLKVSDHHALIPTIQQDMAVRYGQLTEEEKNVFDAVVSSFIAIFMPEYRYSMTEIVTDIAGHHFISKGITILSLGYKEVLKIEPESGEGEEKEEKQILPKLAEGTAISVDSKEIQDKMTKAPGRYTIAGLIAAMEKYSIGTSATRAEIVKKLLNPRRAFITLEKGKYASTELGRQFIQIVPEELKDVELTEHFEEDLKKVNMGELAKEDFLGALLTDLKANIERFSKPSEERIGNTRESIGICPLCRCEVYETAKAYGCSGYKEGCKFVIWKTIAGKVISKQQAQQLLAKGSTAKLKGFTGKKGKFDAALVLKQDGTVGFQFDVSKGKKKC